MNSSFMSEFLFAYISADANNADDLVKILKEESESVLKWFREEKYDSNS